ncbi:MAG TPA: DUF4345 domain-containing protein [Gemmatimonadota bacterium]|nr:DUF4345 domain-containing protein [Gemmatimonadota bacterium]
MSTRALFQGVNGLVAVATVALGGLQLAMGTGSPVYGSARLPPIPVLDSNLRFFGGMAVALGLLMLWALPGIQRRSDVVLAFWGCALLGGVGRLVSAVVVGVPSWPMVVFAAVEVIGAPLMIVWFRRLAAPAPPSEPRPA